MGAYHKVFEILLDLPKTLLFNFYYLPLKKAIKLPMRVSHKVKIGKMGKRDAVVIRGDKHISIGKGGSFNIHNMPGYWSIGENASVVFEGEATFGRGIQLICDGNMFFGSDFYCNAGCVINCGKEIRFGNRALLGWNVTILDGDGHAITQNGMLKQSYESILVGEHVWLAANAVILKGSVIPSNTVVAMGGLVSKCFKDENCLIGNQNKILARDISWSK